MKIQRPTTHNEPKTTRYTCSKKRRCPKHVLGPWFASGPCRIPSSLFQLVSTHEQMHLWHLVSIWDYPTNGSKKNTTILAETQPRLLWWWFAHRPGPKSQRAARNRGPSLPGTAGRNQPLIQDTDANWKGVGRQTGWFLTSPSFQGFACWVCAGVCASVCVCVDETVELIFERYVSVLFH